MFCPKCGTENLETNKYCRSCREDLQLVAQAMKRRLPVLLLSKIDATLDRRSERFRRDSILVFLFSAILLFSAIFVYSSKHVWFWISVILGCHMLVLSVWNYLAFKYSLSLERELSHPESNFGGSHYNKTTIPHSTDNSPVATKPLQVISGMEQVAKKLPNTTNDTDPLSEQKSYCPHCGTENSLTNKFCQTCGINLQHLRKSLRDSRFRLWFDSHLEKYVRMESKDEKIGRNATLLRSVAVYSFVLLINVLMGDLFTLWFYIPFLFLLLVKGTWDFIVYQRRRNPGTMDQRAKSEAVIGATPQSMPAQVKANLTTNQLSSIDPSPVPEPFSITEATTKKLLGKNQGFSDN